PLLSELALKDKGPEEKGVTLRRRRAVWALANLGDNFKRRYLGQGARPEDTVLTADQKAQAVAVLKKEAARKGKPGGWARAARHYGGGPGRAGRRPAGEERAALLLAAAARPLPLVPALAERSAGVDAVLERVARADDPYLRALVAHALNFWDGPRVEP